MLALLAGGCAAPEGARSPTREGEARQTQPADGIEKLIAAQRKRPDERALASPPAPGVTMPDASNLPAPHAEWADTDLDDLLPLLAERVPAPAAGETPAAAPDANSREAALRSYVSGRLARLTGDHERAFRLLDSASRLDPLAGDAFREIGEAQLAEGNTIGAAYAFRKAYDRAPDSPLIVERLGRLLLVRGDAADAAALLARLRAMDYAAVDPALGVLIDRRLATALVRLGCARAAEQALNLALTAPMPFGSPTQFGAELSALQRQRGELWLELGDRSLRRGAFDEALDRYAQAARLPGVTADALLPRVVEAHMRAGRSGEAARALIESIDREWAGGGERLAALVDHLARHSDAGPALSEALTRASRERAGSSASADGGAGSSGLSGVLARSAALALDPRGAAGALRDRLAESPWDSAALDALLTLARDEGPPRVAQEAAFMTRVDPWRWQEAARAVLRNGGDALAVAEALRDPAAAESDEAAAGLLRAEFLWMGARFEDALAAWNEVTASTQGGTAGVLCGGRAAEALCLLGRMDEGQAALAGLAERGSVGALACAEALLALGDFSGAEDALRGEPDGSVPAWRWRLAQARACEGQELWEQAAEHARAVIGQAPDEEDGYAALLRALDRVPGAASEQERVATARALRDRIADSAVVRLARGLELREAAQSEAAQRDIAWAAERSAVREEALGALLDGWRSADQVDVAEAHLRRALAVEPGSSLLVRALAREIAIDQRPAEAATLLRERLAATPGDGEVSRLLEAVLRSRPGGADEADELASRRLAHAPATVRTLLEKLELACRRGELAEATQAAREMATLAARRPQGLGTTDRLRLEESVMQVAQAALSSNAHRYDQALELLEAAQGAMAEPARRMVLARLQLVAVLKPDDVLREADAAAVRPDVGEAAYSAVIARFDPPDRRTRGGESLPRIADPRALQVAEHAARRDGASAQMLAVWVTLCARRPEVEPLRRWLDTVEKAGMLDAVLAEMYDADERADGVHVLAIWFDQRGDTATCERLYRMALAIDPEHAGSNNNLGYKLLNQPGREREGAALIHEAYRVQPNIAAYADSMGWAQYMLGVIEDVTDDAGTVVEPGALSLLERALRMAEEEATIGRNEGMAVPEIRLHLGDALWRAGQHDRAKQEWAKAGEEADGFVSTRRRTDNPMERLLDRDYDLLRQVREGAVARASAAAEGDEPPVTAILTDAPPAAHEQDAAPAASPEQGESPATQPAGAPGASG